MIVVITTHLQPPPDGVMHACPLAVVVSNTIARSSTYSDCSNGRGGTPPTPPRYHSMTFLLHIASINSTSVMILFFWGGVEESSKFSGQSSQHTTQEREKSGFCIETSAGKKNSYWKQIITPPIYNSILENMSGLLIQNTRSHMGYYWGYYGAGVFRSRKINRPHSSQQSSFSRSPLRLLLSFFRLISVFRILKNII